MGVLRDLRGPLVGFAISAFLFIVTAIVGIFVVLTALVSPGTTLAGLLMTTMAFVVSLVLFGFCGLATLAWGLARIASGDVAADSKLLENERLATVARLLERHNEYARELNLSEKVTPSDRERAERNIQQLKEEYAAGEISDHEFERELERQIEEGDLDETSHERDLSRERS